jgi:hypothetical protein
VDQILSDNEMLVRCTFRLKVRAVERYKPRYETISRDVPFLVRGLSTRAANQGSEIEVLDVFEVTGTHTYQSVDRRPITVQVIARFDMQAIEPYFRAMAGRR